MRAVDGVSGLIPGRYSPQCLVNGLGERLPQTALRSSVSACTKVLPAVGLIRARSRAASKPPYVIGLVEDDLDNEKIDFA